MVSGCLFYGENLNRVGKERTSALLKTDLKNIQENTIILPTEKRMFKDEHMFLSGLFLALVTVAGLYL